MVAPDVLLELLVGHSDIGVPSLTALACTESGFCAAVERLWPSLMAKHAGECEKRPASRLPAKPIPSEAVESYHLDDACEVRTVGLERGFKLAFGFQGYPGLTRQQALMPTRTARRTYHLPTTELRLLQSYKTISGALFYKFEDVIGAGMLRFGRRLYMERLSSDVFRKDERKKERSNRMRRVINMMLQYGAANILDADTADLYATDYAYSGIGVKQVELRIQRHNFFAFLVVSDLGPHSMQGGEGARIKHLQKAFALTGDRALVNDAVMIVRARRLGLFGT